MPSKAGPIATIAILAAGGAAVILSGGENGEEIVPVPEIMEVSESQLCPASVRTVNGRLIRITGVAREKDAEVKDTPLGRVVEVASIPDRALCHAVVDARPKNRSQFFPDGNEMVGVIPNIPELKDCYGKASWPVLIGGSCLPGPVGSCLWSMLLKGECCRIVADLPQFLGSTLEEFLKLPMADQQRLLRTRGKCVGDQGQEIGCTVNLGDPRSIANSPVFVPSSWAGRVDLNYVQGEYDNLTGKHKPKSRYEMPEGVGGP